MRKNRTYNNNWVSIRSGAPYVTGFVNGSQCKIVPDTGAEISIVPGCLVYGDQLTGEQVDVKGWDGRPVTLDTAIVDFTFKGRTFSFRVAIAHVDSLCGCVLFSVPMDMTTAEHLLLDAAAKSDVSGLEARIPVASSHPPRWMPTLVVLWMRLLLPALHRPLTR